MKNVYFLISFLFFVSIFTYGQIIHVPEDYPSIQLAIDAAGINDTLLIGNGTYLENPQIGKALTIASNYIFSGDSLDIENTLVDGNQAGSVFSAIGIQTDTLRFIGLTVSNGNGKLCDPQGVGLEQLHGGGFYFKDAGSIVLDNMNIRENHILTEHNSAGGVFCQNSSLRIRNSRINENLIRGGSFFGEGAGLYFLDSEARISNCEISGNSSFVAYGEGGGIYALNSALEILHTVISNNKCIDGGAIHMVDSDAEIHDCDINNNFAHSTGAINYMDFTNEFSFQMTNTSVSENNSTNGLGGIKLYQADADIFNCQINNNVGGQSGGAFNCSASEINIYHSEINNNEAATGIGADGGGMVLYLCTVYLNNVEFKENALSPPNSFNQGGAIVMSNTNLVMDSVVMANNIADRGGAIYSSSSNVRMNHSLIYGHNAQIGGAIYSWGSHYEIISSTITDNSAPTGGGIHSQNNDFIFVNSVLWENTPKEFFFKYQSPGDSSNVDFAFSDIRGHESNFSNLNNAEIVWHEGNLDTDPQFVDADSGDYNLINESPLVDAGIDFFELDDVIIVSYTPEEYVGPAPDMGAYENQSPTISINEVSESNVNIWPNPFNDGITISTPDLAKGNFELINSSGLVLKQGHLSSHTETKINTAHLKPGIYFLSIHSGGEASLKKIVKVI